MVAFSELMNGLSPESDGAFVVSIPDDWMQGRTTYGGLTAAICLQAAYRMFDDLPPLRSAQITFIGPAGGTVQLSPKLLRRGRSACFVAVEMQSEKGIATLCVFCFGDKRETKLDHVFIDSPQLADPMDCEVYIPDGFGPQFAQHYEHRLARGARPMAGSSMSDHYIWVRHKDNSAQNDVALLALADMPPPAILPMLTDLPPVSSISWMLNFHTPDLSTDDCWWLLSTCAENANEGYSSQNMQVWNRHGEAVISGRQNVAIFY